MVLCGGDSRRLGVDKTRQPFGAATVLDHLLRSLPGEWAVVAVGPERPTVRAVAWVREQPTGGGPLAGIAAGLTQVWSPVVVVVGGDMPFAAAGTAALAATLAADPTLQAAAASVEPRPPAPDRSPTESSGERQGEITALRGNPLLVAYRTAAVRAALPPDTAGGRARALLDAVPHRLVAVPEEALLDVDTAADLAAARALLPQRHP